MEELLFDFYVLGGKSKFEENWEVLMEQKAEEYRRKKK